MNPFLVDLARAVDTERLRQARLADPGRRLRASVRTTRRAARRTASPDA